MVTGEVLASPLHGGGRNDHRLNVNTGKRDPWSNCQAEERGAATIPGWRHVSVIRAEEPCGETSASPRTTGGARAIQGAPSRFEHYREGHHQFRLESPHTNSRTFAPSGPGTGAGYSHGP